jgi:segregation and condensation protein B
MFLDYFNLASLDDLPSLAEIKDMDSIEPELEFESSEDDA